MTSMIDRDALFKEFRDFVRASNNSDFEPTPNWNDAISLVGSAPTVDAVQVVRCYECKHLYVDYGCSIGCGLCIKDSRKPIVDVDWYCADGERKEQRDE